MEDDRRSAPSYATAFAALTVGLFVCSGGMVATYVAFGTVAAVAVAVVGGFVMHGLSQWATPALLEDDDIRF